MVCSGQKTVRWMQSYALRGLFGHVCLRKGWPSGGDDLLVLYLRYWNNSCFLNYTWSTHIARLLEQIVSMINKLDIPINFYKVEAHIGVIGNEFADALAKHAALHNYGHDEAFPPPSFRPYMLAFRREQWDYPYYH